MRPAMFTGPMLRHFMEASVAESGVCAPSGATARRNAARRNFGEGRIEPVGKQGRSEADALKVQRGASGGNPAPESSGNGRYGNSERERRTGNSGTGLLNVANSANAGTSELDTRPPRVNRTVMRR